jgi:HK97 family phage portal protein
MANLWQRFTGRVETRAVQPTIPSRSATSVTPDTALTLTSVFRAIQIIGTPISKMELRTFRYATGIEQQIENPILVNKPSLSESRRNFFFMTVLDLALKGNSYWLKSFDSRGQVNDLTLIPADAVSVQLDKPTGTTKVYYYNGKQYGSVEMEHLQLYPRPGQLVGASPIDTCRLDLALALDLRGYAANWFTSAGVPTGVLKTNQPLNPADAETITANWHNKQQNRQIAVLGQGFDYQQVALSPREAMFTDSQAQAVQMVARLFGIPPRLLLTTIAGSSDTYTNVTDENQIFYRHTLMAYTDAITDALSNCLPRGTRVEFDFEHLFKADVAARMDYYKVAIEAGILTAEEVRTKEGLI